MKKKLDNSLFLLVLISLLLIPTGCKENEEFDPNAIRDGDGNVYTEVSIGTQVWLRENLKTTRYLNGERIGTTSPANLDISSENSPDYQWAYVGEVKNQAALGRLYTWYAITDSRGICPEGYHVPSVEEWNTLIEFLGGEMVAGGKLKEEGTLNWSAPNTGASNDFDFTALPGGYRYYKGGFEDAGILGYWWSSTQYDASIARITYMRYNNTTFRIGEELKSYGFSVRCIKD